MVSKSRLLIERVPFGFLYPSGPTCGVPVKEGEYLNLLKSSHGLAWRQSKDDPRGVYEFVLHRYRDGSYTHLLRIESGVEMAEPVSHEFYEEAFYISGKMLNTKTRKAITGGDYVFHSPGEEHGPFRCVEECLILEFRYFK